MKTNRFELKDFRLNEILSMLTTYNGPSLSEELNRVWTGEARTVKFGNRFSVDLTPEDVKENPEFRPNEWNPTKSWNIPKKRRPDVFDSGKRIRERNRTIAWPLRR